MKWFYNFKTAVKLLLAFSVLGIMVVFVGLNGIKQQEEMNNRLNDMYQNHLLAIKPLMETKDLFNQSRNELRKLYMNSGSESSLTIKSLRDDMTAASERLEEFKRTELTAESQEQLPVLETALDSYNRSVDEIIQMASSHQNNQLIQLLNDPNGVYAQGRDDTLAALDKLIDINAGEAQRAEQAGKEAFASGRELVYWITAAALAVTIVTGIFVSGIISRPLRKIGSVAKQAAEGELGIASGIGTTDEVGVIANAVDTMILNVRKVVDRILLNAESLEAASKQISVTSKEIAGSNSNRAESEGKINVLFKELTDVINSVAQNTKQAAELSEQSARIIDKGTEVVNISMNSMNDVRVHMAELEKNSLVIGGIVEMIEDIADRTNLLALSAAIEAARAGEQGRGFAVVADEVRKLAESSSSAEKEIIGMIKGLQEKIKLSVAAVEESVTYSHRTAETFGDIQKIVSETGAKVTNIAAASEEQSVQAAGAWDAVESITAATKVAAAASEKMAATAQTLAQMADELQKSVSIFKIDRHEETERESQ
ncbi:methyl-accepting chemotaxis protein [Paenibacillus sophorae]|uniref:Methyl-accepting chemotaxis protein n=1 Tax=Paenibacillus sophorae TaxID=1333845 RepID=A0A1H8K1X2_9BACL|nr:methyl-accepting chemotaxis protein [Paenibacillus sophorae]QWU13571.1 methyl-accepting chemotaxis protein [Paenibacillus sophorae]SEN86970.1 methyl-accepting chemotaxis protein [Paenibacillus sophorae]